MRAAFTGRLVKNLSLTRPLFILPMNMLEETPPQMRSSHSSPCSGGRFTVNSITSARLIYIATLSRPTSNTIIAQRSVMTMWIAPPHCYAAPKASGFSIDSLTEKRRTRKPALTREQFLEILAAAIHPYIR